MKRLLVTALGLLLIGAAQVQGDLPVKVEPIASFDEPWAMAFLPDGRMLVTEKKGLLRIVTQTG
jgi:glucose/arabinose dehydrogenase